MSIDFKPGSTPGEKQEQGGITWVWDGEKWNRAESSGSSVDSQNQNILDLIIPTTIDSGAWKYSNTAPLAEGSFHISKIDTNGPNLDYADSFSETTTLIISQLDSEGTGHDLTERGRGDYVQLFDDEDVAVALYYVRAEPVFDDGKYYTLVSFINGSDKTPAVDEAFTFKFYEAVPGASGEYVKKRGDVISGPLQFSVSGSPENIRGTIRYDSIEAGLILNNKIPDDDRAYWCDLMLSGASCQIKAKKYDNSTPLGQLIISVRDTYLDAPNETCSLRGQKVYIRANSDWIEDNYIGHRNTSTGTTTKVALWSDKEFRINGIASAGENPGQAFMATEDNHIATKKYVDDKFVLKTGSDLTGTLSWNNQAGSTENPYVGIKVVENSKRGTKTILWAESGGSFADGQLVTELVPTLQTSITNKKYVDDKFDFSQYTELS